ncbi:hypothetical protein VTN96DRAFT_8563 [Rasamsonia emersonii]
MTEKMVTCSLSRPIVWRVSTSEVICSVDNQNNAKAMAVSFLGESDSNIIACLDNSEFWWMSPECSEDGWKPFPVVLRDDSYEFQRSNSPRVVDFSPDRSKVALAYRGLPLSVWALDEPGHASWADANEKATKAKTVKAVLETILMYRMCVGILSPALFWGFSMMDAFSSGTPPKARFRYLHLSRCILDAVQMVISS